MTLLKIAKSICGDPQILTTPFEKCDAAQTLMECIYSPSVWQNDFRQRISDILEKEINQLSLNEVLAYLTFIICTERTQNGCYDGNIRNGVIVILLNRYLELTEQEAQS